jgi:TonB family protein
MKSTQFLLASLIAFPMNYLASQQATHSVTDTLPARISYELVSDTRPTMDADYLDETDTIPAILPTILKKSIPDYPEIAIRVRIEGNITVRVRVDTSGKPIEAEDMRCDFAGFEKPALDAAQKWLFSRYMRQNQPHSFFAILTFKFRFTGRKPLVVPPD